MNKLGKDKGIFIDNNDKNSMGADTSSIENDSDSEISKIFKPQRKTTNLENCTTLIIISATGERREKLLSKRIINYSEIQNEIVSMYPKSNSLFIIQDINGALISPENFEPADIIRAKEILIKPNQNLLKNISPDWENENYHESVYKRNQKSIEIEESNFSDDSSEFNS